MKIGGRRNEEKRVRGLETRRKGLLEGKKVRGAGRKRRGVRREAQNDGEIRIRKKRKLRQKIIKRKGGEHKKGRRMKGKR